MVVYRINSDNKRNSLFNSISLTSKLIIINVFCFVLFGILNLFGVLSLDLIALNPKNILENYNFWTFLTSMFMHGGFFHLLANMLSLYFIGRLVENILGKKRYFWLYIFSGFFAGFLFVISPLIFPSDYNTFAVGASGALFGIIGVLIFLTPNLKVYPMFLPIPIKMKYAAPGMLILLWLISVGANLPIGNVAHFGGLLSGIVYGLYLRYKFPNKLKLIQQRFS